MDYQNLYLTFGNITILMMIRIDLLLLQLTVFLNFPDPWFKKKHHKEE